MPERSTDRRPTFVPVLGAGLAGGALAAVAATRAWVVDAGQGGDPLGSVADAGEMPLASALSLVVLACWGVLLVTRGVVRRAVAALAAVAAAGLLATVVTGFVTLPDQVSEAVAESGFGGGGASPSVTGWFWVAAVASVVTVVAAVLATAWCPAWPEMGSRYDAPGSAGAATRAETPPEEQSNLDLWKSMDEGRDPTA